MIYAVCDFLSEDNKRRMRDAAAECGFGIRFFEDAPEADGRVSDGEILYSDDATLLSQMPQLKWCHDAYAGAVPFAQSGVFDDGRVLLTNSSGAYGLAISEHVIMVTLMLMRRMPEYQKITGRREWIKNMRVRSIAGSNIAIIGTGDIGQNSAKRFKALGARSVIGFSRSGRPRDGFDRVYKMEDFEKLMSEEEPADQIDVLLLCVPGTPEAEGLLDERRIAVLPRKAFVINVGRGTVVDQDALMDALNGERIAGAALDVMYPEPLPPDHPLWDARNCLITSHTSGDMGLPFTVDTTVEIFCDNLRRYVRGEELTHRVDVSAGY